MDRKIKYFLIICVVIICLVVYRIYTYPKYYTPDDFVQLYKPGEGANRENYTMQCKNEFDGNLSFPLAQVSKAVVYKGFFSFDNTLNTLITARLVEIINDTASYVWGEVGTFIPGRQIVFYDRDNKPIGITLLEEERGKQTYSYPYLRRTKWGALTDKAFKEIDELIAE